MTYLKRIIKEWWCKRNQAKIAELQIAESWRQENAQCISELESRIKQLLRLRYMRGITNEERERLIELDKMFKEFLLKQPPKPIVKQIKEIDEFNKWVCYTGNEIRMLVQISDRHYGETVSSVSTRFYITYKGKEVFFTLTQQKPFDEEY